jgi:hypothetical protein
VSGVVPAELTAGDLAVVLVSLAAVAAFVLLLVALQSLLRTLREVRATLERIQRDAVPLVAEMSEAVGQAGAEVERVDELIDAAAAIQHTVDNASRLTYLAFSNPLIKVVAFFRGLGRGTGRALGSGGRRRRRVEERRRERAERKAA